MSLHGYRGAVKELLSKEGVEVGDEVEVVKPDGSSYRGLLMPRYEWADEGFIVLKLKSGYNVGVAVTEGTSVKKVAKGEKPTFIRRDIREQNAELPHVALIGTGGTIASRVDYRTGAVKPALSSEDLLSVVPELTKVAYVEAEVLFSMLSENMTYREWDAIARKVDEEIRKGVDGVVIAHGTDTMHYTAAALSFALQRPPVPIVLVGSQRSSDRPSSDSATNLIAAVSVAARAEFAEVVVAMHDWHSDDVIAIHRGTRVVKLHTSSREAFRSVNANPIAYYRDGRIEVTEEPLNFRGSHEYNFSPGFSGDVALVKYYPSMGPEVLEWYAERGVRGVIIEGTGLGHVSTNWVGVVRKLTRDGVFIGMTSQCKFGRVNMYIYDTGRDLLAAGVTPLEDMLSEVAIVKLMWALARSDDVDEVKRLMLTPIAGELSSRLLPRRLSASCP